jgi:hypothetical protein
MEPMEPTPTATPERTRSIEWVAVALGAAAGLLVLVVAAALRAVLHREVADFDDSGWVLPLFVLVLVGYGVAGWVAERRERRDTPLTHGALAGVGAFILWLPLRVVIWIVRDEDRGLFTGAHPALRVGQVFGHLVIAAGIGMLGALLAHRLARRAPPVA